MPNSNNGTSELLQYFWKLSSQNDNVRMTSCLNLTKYIITEQEKGETKEWSESLIYTFGRLTQGLCSGLKATRLGFSTALTQLLKNLNISKMDDIKKLKNIFHSKIKMISEKEAGKNEDRQIVMGKLFFNLCLIRGVELVDENMKIIKSILIELIEIHNKLSYLKAPAFEAINLLVEKVDKKSFEKYLWPELSTLLSCGWEKSTPQIVLAILIINERYPDLCGTSYLALNNWIPSMKNKKAKILGQHCLKSLGNVLSNACAFHPKFHPCVTKILEEFVQLESVQLVKFWKESVEPSLLTSSPDKKFLALRIAVKILPHLDEKHVKSVWSNNLVMALFYALSNKNNPIHLLCKKILSAELEGAVSSESINPDTQLEFLYALLSSPVGIQIDHLTGSNFIALTARNLKLPSLLKYIDWLKLYYATGESGNDGIKKLDTETIQKWCCSHLCILFKCDTLKKETEAVLGVLKFLLLFAFFHPKSASLLSSELGLKTGKKILPAVSSVKKATVQSFYKVFSSVMSAKTMGNANKTYKKFVKNYMITLVNFCEMLLESDKAILLSSMSKTVKEEWVLVVEDVKKLQECNPNKSDTIIAFTISLLLIFNGLRFLCDNEDDKNEALETSSDLRIVIGEYFLDNRPSGEASLDDSRAWDAIVIEILLAKLAKPSNANRQIADQVFKVMAPALERFGFSLILDAIDPESLLEESDDSEMEDEEGSDSSSSAEEHDSAFSESDEEVDGQFKQSVEAALGPAALPMNEKEEFASGSEEEMEDVDLDDEAMMKFDPMLAEVFKQKNKQKGGEQEDETSQIDFKIRCLDLVETLSTWKSDTDSKLIGHPTLLYGLQKLFTFTEKFSHQEKYKHLTEKLSLILKLKICKIAHMNVDIKSAEDLDILYDDLESLLTSACKAHSQFFSKLAITCASFLVHVLTGLNDHKVVVEPQKRITEICTGVIKKFISEEKSLLLTEVITDFANRYPEISLNLIPHLIKYFEADIKSFKKQQVYSMLSAILKFNESDFKDAKMISKIYETTVQLVKNFVSDPPSIKPKLATEVLRLLTICLKIKSKITEEKPDDCVKFVQEFLKLAEVKGGLKGLAHNILQLCHCSSIQTTKQTEMSEKRKRKLERQKARKEKLLRKKAKQEALVKESVPIKKKNKKKHVKKEESDTKVNNDDTKKKSSKRKPDNVVDSEITKAKINKSEHGKTEDNSQNKSKKNKRKKTKGKNKTKSDENKNIVTTVTS